MPKSSNSPASGCPVKILILIAAVVLHAHAIPAAQAAGTQSVFTAELFTLGYGSPDEDIIPLSALAEVKVQLEERDGVFHAASAGAGRDYYVSQTFRDGKFSESALVAIFQAIANYYNTQGVYGVFVVVNRDDIDPQTHEDYRMADRKDLRLTIWVSRASELRSIAKGTRFTPEESIDNPAHRLIRKYSPLQPADKASRKSTSALRKARLDDYLLDLNRHPARRVDAAISAGATPGEVTLDYLVSETRPWFAYAQISDSGTDVTDTLREHIGFSYYQLTNHDDTLLFDASTSNIDSGFSGSISYNRPLIFPNTLRAKVFAAYSEFTAEDVAVALDEFTGNSIATGFELPWSPFRIFGFSVDIIPGLTWQKFNVDNTSISLKADTDFFAAMLGVRFERNTDTMRTYLRIGYETNFDGDTKMTPLEVAALGRLEAKPGYQIMNFDAGHTMYVEPFLFGEKFYSGDNWRKSARAHEIAASARGQWVVNSERIIPQKQMTLGGMYSVRGYPEATVAGDNVVMGTFEYRLHIPRLFRPYAALPNDRGDRRAPAYFGVPMNWRAPNLHALPDWDFILRLFGDLGRAEVIDTLPWEASHTLASIGFGFEAQLKGFLNARVDWGFAQKSVKTSGRYIENHSSQVHFSVSLLW